MTIYLLDVIEGLKMLPSNSGDIVLIDPPYNIGKNFGNNFDNLDLKAYVAWFHLWFAEVVRILKDTGTIYIYGYSEILAHLFVEINLPKRWLVWHYTNKNSVANKFWQRSHESIIVAWKSDQRIFNMDEVREPYTDVFLKNAAGKKRNATKGRFSVSGKETIYKAHEKGALPRDVIKVAALAGGAGRSERFFYCKNCEDIFASRDEDRHAGHTLVVHPTQKPLELSLKLLKAAKPPEKGVVVVPFAGTGSELLAAQSLGMDGIGFEINDDYAIMANLLVEKGYPQHSINE